MPKKENIRLMFDSIAPEYDAFNHLTSLGIDRSWRRRALRFVGKAAGAAPGEPVRVLDVACGTGDFSLAIARHLARNSREGAARGSKRPPEPSSGQTLPPWSVTGMDISEGMLEVMMTKVAKASLQPAVFAPDGLPENGIYAETGDCCSMRYADGTFDTVTVAFGVRNFEDRGKALREVLRVLKPGGRFVMLELGIPRNPVVRWAYKFYFSKIMPLVGGKMSGNKAAYRYLPASVLSFPGPKGWCATMEAAGFANVCHRALSLGICRLYTGEKPRPVRL